MAKQKTKGSNTVGRVSKEKALTVANDSLQTRAPGAGPGNSQSATRNQLMGFGGSVQGERGGPGSQQASWSSRQQAQRMRARAEEERLGWGRQSGQGGSQQSQDAGPGGSGAAEGGSKQGSDDRTQAANASPSDSSRVRSSTKGSRK